MTEQSTHSFSWCQFSSRVGLAEAERPPVMQRWHWQSRLIWANTLIRPDPMAVRPKLPHKTDTAQGAADAPGAPGCGVRAAGWTVTATPTQNHKFPKTTPGTGASNGIATHVPHL